MRYPYVLVHNYVGMPNHSHTIIKIDRLRITHLAVKTKSLSCLIGAFKTTSSTMSHRVGFEISLGKILLNDHIIGH